MKYFISENSFEIKFLDITSTSLKLNYNKHKYFYNTLKDS